MSVFARIAAVFTGRKKQSQEDRAAAEKAVGQLCTAFAPLVQKADSLRKKYPDIVHRIKRNSDRIKGIRPDISIQAGKIEQTIAQKITCVSSSCDAVLSGGDAQVLAVQLDELEQLLKQRQAIR